MDSTIRATSPTSNNTFTRFRAQLTAAELIFPYLLPISRCVKPLSLHPISIAIVITLFAI